jgi:hypothetical protein
MGRNPPAGAVIDYTLARPVPGPVVLEIADASGRVVRRYSSADAPETLPANRYFSEEWLKPPTPLSTSAGHHRVTWDLRGPRPKAERYSYSIAAIHGEDTPAEPEGLLAAPGKYTVRLSVGGKTYSQPLTLGLDPRVRVPEADIVKQVDLARATAAEMDRVAEALAAVRARRKEAGASKELEARERELVRSSARLSSLFLAVSSGDAAPTAQAVAELEDLQKK